MVQPTMYEETLLSDTVERILRNYALDIELPEKPIGARQEIAEAIAALGLHQGLIPEGLGGAGMSLIDLASIGTLTGKYNTNIPIIETAVANWLLSSSGIQVSRPWLTFGPTCTAAQLSFDGQFVSGHVHGVPLPVESTGMVMLSDLNGVNYTVLVDRTSVDIVPAETLNDGPIVDIYFSRSPCVAFGPTPANLATTAPMLIGSTIYSLKVIGALREIMQLTLQYIQEREAFGRHLSQFQVVQHEAVRLAEEVTIADSTTTSAVDALSTWMDGNLAFDSVELLLEICAAKVRVSDAAMTVCSIAHQLHGAIGFTHEFKLSHLTLSALSWIEAYGTPEGLARSLGKRIIEHGPNQLWPLLASR